MSKLHAEREIQTRKSSTQSIDDQFLIAHALWDNDIGPSHDGLRTAEIEDILGLDLEYGVNTSIAHLRDIDLVEGVFKSHNEWHPVAEWRGDDGEIVFGDDLDAAVREAIEALIDHMGEVPGQGESPAIADGGVTAVRRVVTDEFDYAVDKIDAYLREKNEDVDTLNKAVQAIKESEGVSPRHDYGEINFIPRAYYNRLTDWAVDLYERQRPTQS